MPGAGAQATLPDTEGYCEAGTVAQGEGGKAEQLCCVCLEEDPYWCPPQYKFCNWGKGKWHHRKPGAREAQRLRDGEIHKVSSKHKHDRERLTGEGEADGSDPQQPFSTGRRLRAA